MAHCGVRLTSPNLNWRAKLRCFAPHGSDEGQTGPGNARWQSEEQTAKPTVNTLCCFPGTYMVHSSTRSHDTVGGTEPAPHPTNLTGAE